MNNLSFLEEEFYQNKINEWIKEKSNKSVEELGKKAEALLSRIFKQRVVVIKGNPNSPFYLTVKESLKKISLIRPGRKLLGALYRAVNANKTKKSSIKIIEGEECQYIPESNTLEINVHKANGYLFMGTGQLVSNKIQCLLEITIAHELIHAVHNHENPFTYKARGLDKNNLIIKEFGNQEEQLAIIGYEHNNELSTREVRLCENVFHKAWGNKMRSNHFGCNASGTEEEKIVAESLTDLEVAIEITKRIKEKESKNYSLYRIALELMKVDDLSKTFEFIELIDDNLLFLRVLNKMVRSRILNNDFRNVRYIVKRFSYGEVKNAVQGIIIQSLRESQNIDLYNAAKFLGLLPEGTLKRTCRFEIVKKLIKSFGIDKCIYLINKIKSSKNKEGALIDVVKVLSKLNEIENALHVFQKVDKVEKNLALYRLANHCIDELLIDKATLITLKMISIDFWGRDRLLSRIVRAHIRSKKMELAHKIHAQIKDDEIRKDSMRVEGVRSPTFFQESNHKIVFGLIESMDFERAFEIIELAGEPSLHVDVLNKVIPILILNSDFKSVLDIVERFSDEKIKVTLHDLVIQALSVAKKLHLESAAEFLDCIDEEGTLKKDSQLAIIQNILQADDLIHVVDFINHIKRKRDKEKVLTDAIKILISSNKIEVAFQVIQRVDYKEKDFILFMLAESSLSLENIDSTKVEMGLHIALHVLSKSHWGRDSLLNKAVDALIELKEEDTDKVKRVVNEIADEEIRLKAKRSIKIANGARCILF